MKKKLASSQNWLQPQEKIRKKLRSYQSEFTKMTEFLGQWSKFVDQFQSVERLQDEVMKSRTPNEVETKSNDMKVQIDHQKIDHHPKCFLIWTLIRIVSFIFQESIMYNLQCAQKKFISVPH